MDAPGLHATQSKVEAINEALIPQNITELRSILGLLNYNSKFVRNLSHMLYPLNNLLKKGQKWKWTTACAASFKAAKEALISSRF